jgi:hypothetical protein
MRFENAVGKNVKKKRFENSFGENVKNVKNVKKIENPVGKEEL